MKKLVLISVTIFVAICISFISCKKEEAAPIPVITYKVWGKLDTTKTTMPAARVSKALFTLSYSNTDGNESDAVLNGGFNLLYYTGINNKDTLEFYTTNAIGVDTVFSIENDSIRTTKTSNNYVFNNGDSARFSTNNYPLRSNISANVKLGKGYFRLVRAPKYVFVKLDSVVKL
jgi:hypothetical protein